MKRVGRFESVRPLIGILKNALLSSFELNKAFSILAKSHKLYLVEANLKILTIRHV